ncbi:hypothetical protein CBR_g36903 [Chara braunii]|uniref:Uncharacterized protein n=1 Tax=Chara braunii TaxID=69332 RepID=A0A388JZK4_CHABU|nr:hypothetical protein CBR_g36903 [Chara braunii]|eukprot:GBG63133.1 hypothetical protein CBR_g36903 [Chara braunii]
MEPDPSIEGASVIRVVLLPVGNISAATFREYSTLVVRCRRVDLTAAKSFYTEHQKSPFAHQPWDGGYLNFKFILGGAAKSPWEDFQAHRRIHGVIGICHCPHSPNVIEVYDDFLQAAKAFPGAKSKRCFAFDPTDEHVAQDDKKRQHLVMFPPGNRQLLEFHMQTMMQDFAASLLMAFESFVLHADPVGVTVTTPLDSQSFLSSEEVSKAKKRRLGRVQKTIGDYCLLAGSPVDAHAHYTTAIELSRLTSDSFWLAGALEGIVCAAVVDVENSRDSSLEDEVKNRFQEIINLYRRLGTVSFEVEAMLKVARFLCGRETPKEVTDLLMLAVGIGRGLTDPCDKLVLNVEVARIFGLLGFERKAAFFSRQVAQLYQQQDSRWAAMSALQVLMIAAPLYRVPIQSALKQQQHGLLALTESVVALSRDQEQRRNERKEGGMQITKRSSSGVSHAVRGVLPMEGQWNTLQMELLGDMLAAAIRAQDPIAAWSAAARLLRGHYSSILPNGQLVLSAKLVAAAERMPTGSRCLDPALPIVNLHSFVEAASVLQIVKRFSGRKEWWVDSGQPTTPFIYSPFASQGGGSGRVGNNKVPQIVWVSGEVSQVVVELRNPCSFEVVVDSLFLSVEGGSYDPFPVALSLPANTAGHLVTLSGVPRSVGPVNVRGCFVRSFGVLTEHLFNNAVDVLGRSKVGGSAIVRSGGRQRLGSHVTVVPHLPLLVATVAGGEGAGVLYEGEIRDVQLSLTNVGAAAVDEVHMSLSGRNREQVLSIGQDVLQSSLPLLPGSCVLVPIRLRAGKATMEAKGSDGPATLSRPSTARAGVSNQKAGSTVLTIHYAGKGRAEGSAGVGNVSTEALPPGRRLTIPLQLHVLQGLTLVRARLLPMDVRPRSANFIVAMPGRRGAAATGHASKGAGGELERYPGPGPGLRLMELELFNTTDVLFEVSVMIRQQEAHTRVLPDGECEEDPVGTPRMVLYRCHVSESPVTAYPATRIDRDCSARLLIPIQRFRLRPSAGGNTPRNARDNLTPSIQGQQRVRGSSSTGMADPVSSRSLAELDATVDSLASQICVRWQSGRNSTGELSIRDAIRQALEPPAFDLLFPDPVTFTFVVGRSVTQLPQPVSSPSARVCDNTPSGHGNGRPKLQISGSTLRLASLRSPGSSPMESPSAVSKFASPAASSPVTAVVAYRAADEGEASPRSANAQGGDLVDQKLPGESSEFLCMKATVRELTPIVLIVRNNSPQLQKMAVTISCQDVAGSNCLGSEASKATVLWAGTLTGAELVVGPWSECMHKFALYFLVPGSYTLIGSCFMLSDTWQKAIADQSDGGARFRTGIPEVSSPPLSIIKGLQHIVGEPFKIRVV